MKLVKLWYYNRILEIECRDRGIHRCSADYVFLYLYLLPLSVQEVFMMRWFFGTMMSVVLLWGMVATAVAHPPYAADAAVLVSPLPTRPVATPGLPPRPTDVPTATPVPVVPTPTIVPQPTAVNEGALIQLVVGRPFPPVEKLWTVVQWGDGHGRWYDVDGWRGTLDDVQLKTWWVAPADFGDAPFRWRVYEEEGGRLLATSSSFALPTYTGQVVRVEVNLTPTP
jgi:hypothetical protein